MSKPPLPLGPAMEGDDADFWTRHQERKRQIAALLVQCESLRAANRATLERLRASERHLARILRPLDPPDA